LCEGPREFGDETELHHALCLQRPGGAEHCRPYHCAFDQALELHFDPPFSTMIAANLILT
jgi:hypothetical protein